MHMTLLDFRGLEDQLYSRSNMGISHCSIMALHCHGIRGYLQWTPSDGGYLIDDGLNSDEMRVLMVETCSQQLMVGGRIQKAN